MPNNTSSRLARLWHRLRPDAEARRYLPILSAIAAVYVFILVISTNRYVTCEHYPDYWREEGTHHYRCENPKWHRTCSHIIPSGLTDICLRQWGPGMTLIHHKQELHDLKCQAAKGPTAYSKGSEGCACREFEDKEGHCRTFRGHCRAQYGSGAMVDVVNKPELALEVLLSKESIHLVCRCPEGQAFDDELERCG